MKSELVSCDGEDLVGLPEDRSRPRLELQYSNRQTSPFLFSREYTLLLACSS